MCISSFDVKREHAPGRLRGILERTAVAHRILRSAAAPDAATADLPRADAKRRRDGQRVYVKMLLTNGPLRDGLTPGDAAATYSALPTRTPTPSSSGSAPE